MLKLLKIIILKSIKFFLSIIHLFLPSKRNKNYISSRGVDDCPELVNYPTEYWKDKLKKFGFSNEGHILEIGCGLGQWLEAFQSLGNKVTGIDIEERYIAFCKKRLDENLVHSLLVEDAKKLPFEDNYFDAVFSYGVLMYVDYEKAFAEAVRVLKPGGKLHITVQGLGYPLYRIKIGFWTNDAYRFYFGLNLFLQTLLFKFLKINHKLFSYKELENLFKKHNIEILDTQNEQMWPTTPSKVLNQTVFFYTIGIKQ